MPPTGDGRRGSQRLRIAPGDRKSAIELKTRLLPAPVNTALGVPDCNEAANQQHKCTNHPTYNSGIRCACGTANEYVICCGQHICSHHPFSMANSLAMHVSLLLSDLSLFAMLMQLVKGRRNAYK